MLGILARLSTSRLLPLATAALSALMTVVPAATARSDDAPQATPKRVNPNAKAISRFQEEINEYVELHRILEETLTPVPRDATPEMIDTHQRDLGRLVQQARKNARAGDIFQSDVRPVLRKLLTGLFNGPDGKQLRMAVAEENPGESVKLVVNGRYPDTIPLSSMPPQVLRTLPQLPAELEYRFIQSTLIILDVHAHIIVDYMTGAVPK
jgi:hypothetical protein